MKKEKKDQAILQAAENEFLAKGFQASAMETIAKEAGVSKATLYKYYPTKKNLFETLVESLFSQIEESLSIPYEAESTVEELLLLSIQKKFTLLSDTHFMKLCRILVIEKLKANDSDPEFNEKFYEGRSWFSEWVKKCQKDNKISKEHSAEDISNWFHSTLDGLIFWPLLLGVKTEITQKNVEECNYIVSNFFLYSFCK